MARSVTLQNIGKLNYFPTSPSYAPIIGLSIPINEILGTGGTSQFLFSEDGTSNYVNRGLCEGTNIGISYGSEFITINYTGGGGGTQYGASVGGGLVLTGTSFSVAAGQGITVSTGGVSVDIGTDPNLFFRTDNSLGVSSVLTGVSYQGRPVEIEYGGTGITNIGVSQFLYSSDGLSISPIGLSAGNNVTLDYDTFSNFIQISSTGGGGGGGATSLGDLTDTNVDTSNLILGNTAPNINLDKFNTGVGISALFDITSGTSNSALGYNAGENLTTGNANVAIGTDSLNAEVQGVGSVAVGYNTLSRQVNNTSANVYNTAVGWGAGHRILSGTSCTFIGACTGTGLNGDITGTNITCLGFGAQPSSLGVSNEVTLGNIQITTLRCADQTIASLSDARDKNDIRDLSYGLNFLENVRPVEFTWDRRVLTPDDENDPKQGKRRVGFIAQELEEAMPNGENDILDLVYKSNPKRLEAKYGNLIPVIVKAVQDLKSEVDKIKEHLNLE